MKFDSRKIEAACLTLFGHEFWQVVNDDNCAKIETYLTAQHITEVAAHGWGADLPVSWCLAKCIELELYRVHIKRFIQTVYHTNDVKFSTWADFGGEF